MYYALHYAAPVQIPKKKPRVHTLRKKITNQSKWRNSTVNQGPETYLEVILRMII